MHIYETAAWWGMQYHNWVENSNQAEYLQILSDHRDKIVFEVTGHDHLADLRTASVPSSQGEFYLNKVIFPGLTSASG